MPSAADAGHSFTLRIERSMAGLEQLGGWVDKVAAALGLDKAADYALRLCLEEAAANVVMHGTAGADGGRGFRRAAGRAVRRRRCESRSRTAAARSIRCRCRHRSLRQILERRAWAGWASI